MIDLHIHTNFSDGTDSLEELVDKIVDRNIKYFSITDHDTFDGVVELTSNIELMHKLDCNNIKFVSGIEMSGIVGTDKVHLIGYNYDFTNNEIIDFVNYSKQKRNVKYDLRLKALKDEKGIVFSKESLEEMGRADFAGKAIMCNYLIRDGFASTMAEGYKIMNTLKIKPLDSRIEAEIIIPAIVGADGICVWAHPLGGINEPRISFEKVEEIITRLKPLGLRGLECFYNLYSKEECTELVKIANKHNLLISAGSDYHGKNKIAKLGEVLNCDLYDATKEATIIAEIF